MTNLDHLSTDTLADYAEGLLRESEASSVATHLRSCADCRAEELLLASLSDILAADSPGPMPAMYAARIDKALAEVAMTDPLSGSFRSEGSAYQGAALDLTPSAFAASTAPDVPSADVIDLSARRRLVAQGLSRVSTVAASIVLLIGGTVLGLQAINTGEGGAPSPDMVAEKPQEAEATVQPKVGTRATAVPIDRDAKKNDDGSYTNKNGTVVRKDGTAVTVDGKVIKVPKTPKGPGKDPAQPGGGTLEPENPPLDVTGKSDGKIETFAERPPAGPVVPEDQRTQTLGVPGDTQSPETGDTPTTPPPAEGTEATADPEQKPDEQATSKATSDVNTQAAKSAVDSDRDPYFRQSGDTYDSDNFARKVLDLLQRGGFTASSTGTPVADPEPDPSVDPASDPSAPATDATPASTRVVTPSSVAIAMTSPGSAGAPTAPDASAPNAAAAVGPASFKARAIRCSQDFGGKLLAADEARWNNRAVTVIVMTDPKDDSQVVGRVIEGGCNDRKPAKDNVRWTQYVVVRAAE